MSRARRAVDAYVVGAGGQARETFLLVERTSGLRFRGYLVDERWRGSWGTRITGGKILGPPSLLRDREGVYFVGIGDSGARQEVVSRIGRERLGAALIAPDVYVHRSNELGPGTLICRGATLTVDAVLGAGVLINCNASVAHDVRIGDYSTCAPASTLSGNVTLGERVWIGTGATVIEKCTVAADVLVGAGAVVVTDLLGPGTYVGVPARRLNGDGKRAPSRAHPRR